MPSVAFERLSGDTIVCGGKNIPLNAANDFLITEILVLFSSLKPRVDLGD